MTQSSSSFGMNIQQWAASPVHQWAEAHVSQLTTTSVMPGEVHHFKLSGFIGRRSHICSCLSGLRGAIFSLCLWREGSWSRRVLIHEWTHKDSDILCKLLSCTVWSLMGTVFTVEDWNYCNKYEVECEQRQIIAKILSVLQTWQQNVSVTENPEDLLRQPLQSDDHRTGSRNWVG